MRNAEEIERIREKYRALDPVMDERMRRQWAAIEANALGWGRVATVAPATGLARNTIKAGIREVEYRAAHPDEPVKDRIRRHGSGRKRFTESDPMLLEALETLVDPVTRGDLESPLRWTCKSTAKLAAELTSQNHGNSAVCDRMMLKEAGYIAFKQIARREGAHNISIETHSLSISMGKSLPSCDNDDR